MRLIGNRYHVPKHVQQHIDYITPGLRLTTGGKKAEKRAREKRGFKAKGGTQFSPPVIGSVSQEQVWCGWFGLRILTGGLERFLGLLKI